VWGILAVSLGVLSRLKLVGVSDKYIQQNDPDQELAFQHAFTMEAIVTAISMVPLFVALPLVGLVYGHWKVLPAGAAVIMALPAAPFTASLWVYYRRMEFAQARLLQALDPLMSFVVTIGLAVAGAGYWALIGGLLAGAWSTAIGCAIKSPYRYRWRYERQVMRIYRTYSVPLLISTVASLVLANSGSIALNVKLGLAGVGVAALAANITSFSTNVDDIVSGTIYPAICAVQDRLDLLRESFEKANRLALMWAMPFGIGLALFCGDLVRFGLGPRWQPGVQLLQITGVVVAVAHIGFNWDDYLRARANTKPIGITAGVTAVAFLAVGIPLTLLYGLRGFGAGVAAQAVANLACRAYYLRRLFPDFVFMRHAIRACMTTAPAAVAVLAVRLVTRGNGSFGLAVAELALFVIVVAAATWVIERRLLREAAGYMLERRRTVVA
jgi:PST family polysaccharide transporter